MRLRGLALLTTALAAWLILAAPAAANRFGPPYIARVGADPSTVYWEADLNKPVGPIQHGAILVVIGQQTDQAGHE